MKKIVTTSILCFLALAISLAQHHSNRAYLGVHSNPVSKKKAKKLNFEKESGAYITNVVNNTAAEKNGLKPFDFIYQIGEYEFNGHQSLRSVMGNFQPGDEAMVYFVRDGKQMSKNIQFGNQADAKPTHRTRKQDPFLGVEQNHNNVPSSLVGVSVDIIENSTAEKMGLEDNDIIMEINNYPMYDWHDVGTAVDMMEVGDEMKVKYQRENKITVAYAPVQSLAATKDGYSHGSYSSSYSWNSGHHNANTNENDKEGEATNEENQETEVIASQPEMEDMEINMEDMPEEEATQMKEELGIDMPVVQNLSIEELTIFPNPSQGIFNLEFFLPNNAPTAIRIFDSNGKMIYANDLGDFQGEFNERLDLSRNPAGTYYLMVQQGKLSISKKVIIVRA